MVRFRSMSPLYNKVFLLVVIVILITPLTSLGSLNAQGQNAGPGNGGFRYGEALQKAILFYEAQRSGRLSTSSIPTRFTWRGDSQLLDGQDNGIDLTGGWVDAGDNVKFIFPMTEAVALLAWGGVEYRQALTNSGQLPWLLNQLRWANDWFVKAHPSANVFYGQVGLGGSDHSYWAPVEVTNLSTLSGPTAAGQPTNRPSFSINPSCGGGADLAGGAAAAMAASSIVFRPTDPTYANTLLNHAVQLDAFAHTNQQVYTACISDAANFYQSYSGFKDELVWSSIWLAKAKDAQSPGSGGTYWNTARTEYNNLGTEPQSTIHSFKWTLAWDDKSYGAYALMAQQFPNDPAGYNADVERWLNYWSPGGGITYTNGGHAKLDQWGSFRYAANTAFIAFTYADHITDPVKQTKYRNFAEQQINYMLGQNPRGCSYMMGFGACPPLRPHHRTAHGSWVRSEGTPPLHRHILFGALSGSPGNDDSFSDDIGSFQSTEPAVDYNAGLVGALARMYQSYGGAPLTDAQLTTQLQADNPAYPHTCADEFLVEAKINASSATFTEISAYLNNRSGWPARNSNQLKFRYFFTLDSANISDVSINSNFSNGATVSGPTLWDAANKIYYLTIDFTGVNLYPGGQSPVSRREVQFRLTNSAAWNPANDPSFNGWNATYPYPNSGYSYAASMPIYEGAANTKLCGSEPSPSNVTPATNTPTRTNTPTNTSTRTFTPTNTPASPTFQPPSNTPTGSTNTPGTPTNTPTRTNTATSTPTRTNTPIITNTPTTGALKVQVQRGGSDNNQQSQFNFKLMNTSSTPQLGLSVRVYFQLDGSQAISKYVFEKYWDQSNVAIVSGPTLVSGNVYYYTISYGTAALPAGGAWQFNGALHLTDWTFNFSAANDFWHTGYAVGALPTAFTDTVNIPAIQGSTVVWGQTP
jgi:endoglucanase